MRVAVVASALWISVVGISVASDADAAMRRATNIPAQSLGSALNLFAKERDLQVVYRSEVIGGLHTHGASGEFTPDEALKELLNGTNLTYHYLDDRTITIVPRSAPVDEAVSLSGREREQRRIFLSQATVGEKTDDGFLRTAQAETNDRGLEDSDTSKDAGARLEEVVVTAQKRTEKLQDVPMSIGVQTAADLEKFHALQLTDFSGYIAGLSVQNFGFPGVNRVMLRGLGLLGGATPLVSTYLDDSPVGGVIGLDAANAGPDINPYDVERVEVLRGPQGTLWGASSVSGMVRYVTAPPDLHSFSARSGADLISVSQSSQLGYGVRGMLNVPLVEGRLALKATGSRVENPGYIDNLLTGKKDENSSTFDAGGLALLWKATDSLAVKLQARLQRSAGDDQNSVNFSVLPGTDGVPVRGGLINGALTSAHALPNSQLINLQRYALNLDWQLGFADLFSTTAYSRQKTNGRVDLTDYWRFYVLLPVTGVSNGYASGGTVTPSSKLVQEIRLVSPEDHRVEWLLGAFFNDEKLSNEGDYFAFDEQFDPVVKLIHSETKYTYKEWALFGNATYKFSPRFDATAGLRWAHNRQTFDDVDESGAYYDWCCGGGQNALAPSGGSQDSAYSYALSSRYHFREDAMAYARIATGFRPGGPNLLTPNDKIQVPGVPDSYDPDTDINYEVGLKADYMDHRVQLEASVFRINLSDIQVLAFFEGANDYTVGATVNAGKARSDGIELSLNVSPTQSLHLAATTAYSKAIFLNDQLSFGGQKGDLIPGAPQWTGSLSMDYSRPVSANWKGTVSGGLRYQSKHYDYLNDKVQQLPMASTLTDLNVALSDSDAHWRIALYARNLFDKRVYSRSFSNFGSTVAYGNYYFAGVNQPRTLGLSVDRSF